MSEQTQDSCLSNEYNPRISPDGPTVYQITIEGHLSVQWSDWFGGMQVILEDNGNTLLTGPVIDQAALYGLLKKVRDLGMPLIAVFRLDFLPGDASETKQ